MLSEIEDCVRKKQGFALEITLSGTGYRRKISGWRSLGYSESLCFLSLPNPELAIFRVKERVRQWGHSIPDEVIRRLYTASLRNFETIYKKGWMTGSNSTT